MRLGIFNSHAIPRILRGVRFGLREGFVFAIIAIVGDLAVRFLAPQYLNNVYDHEFTGGHPQAINADGYRGDVVPHDKPDGELRVLCLGDSVTFGTGAASETTWPQQLSAAPESATPITAINAGVQGASIPELDRLYREKWSAYLPDRVVLASTPNMVAMSWNRRDDPPVLRVLRIPKTPTGIKNEVKIKARRFFHWFALPRFLKINSERAMYWIGLSDHRVDPRAPYGPMLAHGIRQENFDPAVADDAWTIYERDLAALNETLAGAGHTLSVVYIPTRFKAFDGLRDNEKNVDRDALAIDPGERVRSICDRSGIDFIDGAAAIAADRERIERESGRSPGMYIQFDFTHLDADGHAAIARAVAQHLSR